MSAAGLRKDYGGQVVLDGVDLGIGEGEVFALLGPNGAAKTTIVRIPSTLIPADAGTASVMGHDLHREPAAFRAAHVDGLGTFVQRPDLVLLARPGAGAGATYPMPWTRVAVRLVA